MGSGGRTEEGAEGRLCTQKLVERIPVPGEMADTELQGTQVLRTVSAARTMYEISTQATMYIPVSIPPNLPQYVELDRSSQWHTSALLSTALETVTLPSRLRYTGNNQVTFDTMGAALNVNGSQRIANLQCSVVDPSVLKSEKSRCVKGIHDRRVRVRNTTQLLPDQEDSQITPAKLDMDFFSGGPMNSVASLSRRETAHTFGQVESLRGEFIVDEEDDDEEAGFRRKRRRLANLPLLEKLVTPHRGPRLGLVFQRILPCGCMYRLYCHRANYRLLKVPFPVGVSNSRQFPGYFRPTTSIYNGGHGFFVNHFSRIPPYQRAAKGGR